MGKGIPDRWTDYKPMGTVVPGTRFVACKVPLKETLLRKLDQKERFGPDDLKKAFPKLGLVIDLTNTDRYYSSGEFTKENIEYEKILCPGQVLPPNSIVKQFFDVVDQFIHNHQDDPEAVIAVHCTHGLNRTGYFICRYMIEHLNIPPEDAIKDFQVARGHVMERTNYVDDLKNGCKGGSERDLKKINQRFKFMRGSRDSRIYREEREDYGTKRWGCDDSRPSTLEAFNRANYGRRRGRIANELDVDEIQIPHGRTQTYNGPPNKRRIYGYNGYDPTIYLQDGVPNDEMDIESDSPGQWRKDMELHNSPLKYARIPSNSTFETNKFRSGNHQNRLYNEGKYVNIDLTGSWRQEKIPNSEDRTPSMDQHVKSIGPSNTKSPMSNPKSRNYQSRRHNVGQGEITNIPGSWRREQYSNALDVTSSKVEHLQHNPQLPDHKVILDKRNHRGGFFHHRSEGQPPLDPIKHDDDRPEDEPPILQRFSWTPDRFRPPQPHSPVSPSWTPYRYPEVTEGSRLPSAPYVHIKRVFTPQNCPPNPETSNKNLPQCLPRNPPGLVHLNSTNARGSRWKRRR